MIVYFGSNGQLLEVIEEYTIQNSSGDAIASSFITNAGNINCNKIFALFEGETPTASQCAITYKMPNGEIFSNASFFGNALVDGSIKFDKSRDLKYLSYGKTYEFVQFNLPSALLSTGGAGVYQTNITLYPSSEEAKDYSQFSFKALGTPASLVVNEITDTQYQLILAEFADYVPYTGASKNVDIGSHRLTAGQVFLAQDRNETLIDLEQNGSPYIWVQSSDNGEFKFIFPTDGEEADTYTIATRELVENRLGDYLSSDDAEALFVPYTGANNDLNLGSHNLTANQLYISHTYSGIAYTAWVGVLDTPASKRGDVYIYDGTHYRQFNFPNDGASVQDVATREWVNSTLEDYLTISDASSTYLTISDASETYLPLTGGTMSGSITIDSSESPTWSNGLIVSINKSGYQGITAILASSIYDMLTDPIPAIMMSKGSDVMQYDFKGIRIGQSGGHRLLIPKEEVASADKTLATREWVGENYSALYVHKCAIRGSSYQDLGYINVISPSGTQFATLSDLFDAMDTYGYSNDCQKITTLTEIAREKMFIRGSAYYAGKFYVAYCGTNTYIEIDSFTDVVTKI